MDLKSGCMFWPGLHPRMPLYAPLAENLRCQTVVIGCGISGALVSYYLANAGIKTIAIDRREPCTGSTAASTGLLQYETDTSLCELTRKIGSARANRAYQVCYQAIDKFKRLVTQIGDSCDILSRESLYLASVAADVEPLRRECEARTACGIPVEYLTEGQSRARFSFHRPAALWSATAAQVDPYHLSHALLNQATRRGLRVFGHTTMNGYKSYAGGITVETQGGCAIEAQHIVFATGYETPELLGRYIGKLKSTYALVSHPLASFQGWFQRCLIWETARPYLFGRTTDDGRAMIGGEYDDVIDPIGRDKMIPSKIKALTKKFHELFPDIPMEPACAWAGTFAQTEDGLPYIGSFPEFPRAYFALGYGGNGILFSLIAAEIIRDHILGIHHPDAALFSFSR